MASAPGVNKYQFMAIHAIHADETPVFYFLSQKLVICPLSHSQHLQKPFRLD